MFIWNLFIFYIADKMSLFISIARYFVIQKGKVNIFSVKIYRVIHGEKSIFGEVILLVIVRNKKVHMNLCLFLNFVTL
jgi:hypothetical protein